MVATWVEASAKGRLGGPVRAGMWASVVVGTNPVEPNQEVWLELLADEVPLGPLPAYWLENKGVNSLWHVPIPPQGLGARLRYRSGARQGNSPVEYSPFQDVIVRSNLPDRTESQVVPEEPEGLVGNRLMTVRVDSRGSTYDVYFPTVGLHSDVRPAEGDLPQNRSHFRAIVAGLSVGQRLDWFAERTSWEVFQHYQGATNLLVTDLTSRSAPIRVRATDLVVMGPDLPRTAGGSESPGQYLKRFRITNAAAESRQVMFSLYVQAEVNGGIGEPGLSWHDGDRCLLATNRGHTHVNRKLARDATVEFGIALDDRGEVRCEPTGPDEAILLRPLQIPAGATVAVDVLVTGAFTGWRADGGTFEHWICPALAWFRSADLDQIEQSTAAQWDAFVEPLPELKTPRSDHAITLRRSALAAALHCDARWGAVASGFDRGLNAYCLPRDAIFTGASFDRVGHPEIPRAIFDWLGRVRGLQRPYAYWFQKYTIDGWPEWETPAVDQTALIPWAVERHYRRVGDLDRVVAAWPMVEQAAAVCGGGSGHAGLRYLDDLSLLSSAGLWDSRFGAFLYSNTCVVAGLRAAANLAVLLDKPSELIQTWRDQADQIWNVGILSESAPDVPGPGLVDAETHRFLEARRISTIRGLWSDRPEFLVERSAAVDVALLGPTVPFDLLPADDLRVRRTAEAILRLNKIGQDANALTLWTADPSRPDPRQVHGEWQRHEQSSQASLWMVRYLIRLGRETGEGPHWTQAIALLDSLICRLCPLGLGLRPRARRDDPTAGASRTALGVWGLHAFMIDALLDLAGLDYDAPERRLTLQPSLPPRWPQIGLSQPLPCGKISYQFVRPVGSQSYRLLIRSELRHPVTLQVDLTCPDLVEVGLWTSQPEGPPPSFDRTRSRLSWSRTLPEGEFVADWSWGRRNSSEGQGV